MRDVCSCSWKNGTHHPKCEARLLVTCNSCGLLFTTRGCTPGACNYRGTVPFNPETNNKHLGSSFDEHTARCAEDTARKLEVAIEALEWIVRDLACGTHAREDVASTHAREALAKIRATKETNPTT